MQKKRLRKILRQDNIKASTRIIKRNIFYTWDAVPLLVNGNLYKAEFGYL
jgi:hypothetical protein